MLGEEHIREAFAAPAPKEPQTVTMGDIEASIVGEYYFTAHDAVVGSLLLQNRIILRDERWKKMDPLALLTICVLVLDNGFTIVGKSACADPKNFNAEIGKKIAREDAVRQIWPFLGFQLRTKLSEVEK